MMNYKKVYLLIARFSELDYNLLWKYNINLGKIQSNFYSDICPRPFGGAFLKRYTFL